MKISHSWLQKYFEARLPEAKALADSINAHSFEIESLENVGADAVLDVKVLPDKAHYALCHKGIAREVSAITGLALKSQNIEHIKSETKTAVPVKIEDASLCSRYMARRVENVNIQQSPFSIKEKIEAIGGRAINNIVDATNYVMFDIGQPLHAFDADKIEGGIVVRKAKKGEKIELLPETMTVEGKLVEKERVLELSENDLIIADDAGPLAIAGVKGGRRAEIGDGTKNIVIEAANFNPVSIRRTSTRLNLRNDASKRFENEIIPELAEEAMNEVSGMIRELCPEAKFGPVTDEFIRKTEPWNVKVASSFIVEKTGLHIKVSEIERILKGIPCEVHSENDEFTITPPLNRLDLKIAEDFVDEVARMIGYENVPSTLPPSNTTSLPHSKTFFYGEQAKNVLVGLGFSEVLLYSLVAKGDFEIAYPLASDKSALRVNFAEKMLSSLKLNSLNADLLGLDTVQLFEIGKVFPKEGEKTVLVMGVSQVKKKKGVTPEMVIDEAIAALERDLSIQNMKSFALKSKSGNEILKDGSNAIIEIDFDAALSALHQEGSIADLHFEIMRKDLKYKPFSPYPFIVRDIAVFVPEGVEEGSVWGQIEAGIKEAKAESLLAKHSLFDVFKKDGKTSYAFRLIFQSMDRTLTDDEVKNVMEKVYDELKNSKWEVR